MKVRLHLLALAMVSIAAYGEGVEDKLLGVADTSRVHDLEEVIVVTQPKESYLLRKQPLSSTLFSAGIYNGCRLQTCGNFPLMSRLL